MARRALSCDAQIATLFNFVSFEYFVVPYESSLSEDSPCREVRLSEKPDFEKVIGRTRRPSYDHSCGDVAEQDLALAEGHEVTVVKVELGGEQ